MNKEHAKQMESGQKAQSVKVSVTILYVFALTRVKLKQHKITTVLFMVLYIDISHIVSTIILELSVKELSVVCYINGI